MQPGPQGRATATSNLLLVAQICPAPLLDILSVCLIATVLEEPGWLLVSAVARYMFCQWTISLEREPLPMRTIRVRRANPHECC